MLVVHYHAFPSLRRCLQSVLRQLGPHDEMVVVDQEATDDTLRGSVPPDPRLRVVPSPRNIGFAAGVNVAARATTAPYLLLLNPDVQLEPLVIEGLRAALAAQPQTAIAGPRVLNDDGSVQPSARRFPDATTLLGGRTSSITRRFPNNWFADRNLLARTATATAAVDWVSGCALMTRRDVFERLGGLDENFFLYWEDADLCRRAAAAGLQTIYVPEVSVRHSVGASAAHNPELAIRAFHESALYWYRKYAGPIARLATPLVRVLLYLRQRKRLRAASRSGPQLAGRPHQEAVNVPSIERVPG